MKTFVAFCLGGLCAAALIWGTARTREQKCRQRAVAAQAKAAVAEKKTPVLTVRPGDYPEPLDLEPWVTRSGTLQHNCGHVQGACVSKDAVYMTLHNGIYKYDWRGNLLKSVPAQVHQGDICYSKGKLYVSVAVQIKRAGEPEGRIDVYDENLNFLTNAVFAKPADGITCMNGVLYVGLGPARVKDDPYCGSWYGTFDEKTLRPLTEPRLVRHGSEVCAGVQNICNDGEKLYVQVYTPEMGTPCFLIFDKDFNLLGSDVFGWRNGLDIVNWKGKPYFIYFSTLSNGKHFPPVQALMRYAELNPYGKLTDISDWCYFISPSGRYRELYRKTKDRRSEGRHMTFMEYNIFQCWGWDKPIDHRSLAPGDFGKLPQIAEIIRGQNPDWIVLCEAARGYRHSGFIDQPAEFAKRCGLKATYFSGGGLTNRWGNAILSKESPLSTRVVRHYDGKNPCSVIVAEFRDYFVLATHFPLKEPDQMKSAGIVLAEARKLTGAKPVFLAGDLNATPGSRPIARLKEAFTVLSSQEAMTWPSHAPRMCIDYIMVDTGHAGAFKVKAAQALPETTAADHRPVVVEAEWKRK